jgi:hypothetical protein
VSLSWRDRVRIDLAPDRVALTRFSRGFRPRLVEQGIHEVHAAPASATAPWQAAVDLLDRTLTEARWRKAKVHVRLSSHFLRLHLLPFSAALATDDERLAFARMELEAVHGERVSGWTLILDDAPAGAATPVCAVDTALLDALRTSCTRAALTLGSIRPAFAAALEGQRGRARPPRYGFAFAEDGRVTVALYEGGTCRWLANPRVGAALTETVGAELQQAQVLGGIGGGGRLQVAFAERRSAGGREGLPLRIGGWEVSVAETDEPGAPAFPMGVLEVARH